MITISTSARAIAVIRKELTDVVLPNVTDQRAITSLQMIDFTLRQIETAQDHQLAWMREEIDEIGKLAIRVTQEVPSANVVKAAVAALEAGRATSDELESVRQEYSLAGEVLSCIIELVIVKPGALKNASMELMERRLARELKIRGDFKIVGQQ